MAAVLNAPEGYEKRVLESFERQQAMHTLGASVLRVEPGRFEIGFDYVPAFTQQHGFMHSGILATILDTACGLAAFTLFPPETGVLTVDFKINLLRPAAGERFVARAEVTKPGRTITFTHGEMYAEANDEQRLVATMTATMMTIVGKSEITG